LEALDFKTFDLTSSVKVTFNLTFNVTALISGLSGFKMTNEAFPLIIIPPGVTLTIGALSFGSVKN
jgi:hypothetical protein